jgi:predicted GIY-YIG superfamily endonuclease
MAWVYILPGSRRYYIGATENLDRRLAEQRRGSNHTTRRLGEKLLLAAAKEVPSMAEARLNASSNGRRIQASRFVY